jgi:hypothetical protein
MRMLWMMRLTVLVLTWIDSLRWVVLRLVPGMRLTCMSGTGTRYPAV